MWTYSASSGIRKSCRVQLPSLVRQQDSLNVSVGNLLNVYIPRAVCDPGGCVIVNDDILPVRSPVDIRLDAVVAPVSGGHKGGIGVFLLDSAQSPVSNHLCVPMIYFYGVHF